MCDLEFWAFGFLSGAVNRIAGWVDITGKYSVGESAVVARALGVLHRLRGLTESEPRDVRLKKIRPTEWSLPRFVLEMDTF
jgi:hypothetical protein